MKNPAIYQKIFTKNLKNRGNYATFLQQGHCFSQIRQKTSRVISPKKLNFPKNSYDLKIALGNISFIEIYTV